MLLEIVDDTITYGRSVVTIADQLFGKDATLTDEQKTQKAQKVYDSVLEAFPDLKTFMNSAQAHARKYGYVCTILGRRRHIPDMQLPPYEFRAMKGYVNPDVDPLDVNTLSNVDEIPQRIVDELTEEFKSYKYFGQAAKRIKELAEDYHIRVINNRSKINDATRLCVNCVDFDTEILTTSGWKRYNEVNEGDEILSYSVPDQLIVTDHIQSVHVYLQSTEVVKFESGTFSAVSTMDHRWVVGESDEIPRIRTTRDIVKHKWPDYPILRVADNEFISDNSISDDQLKILGWFLTDGNRSDKNYGIHLYQSTKRDKNRIVYDDIITTLHQAQINFTDYSRDNVYHEIYLKKSEFTYWMWDTFIDRCLTFEFISRLSQHQCNVLMRAMLQGDGSGVDGYDQVLPNSSMSIICNSECKRDTFQYLCFRAGFATNSYEIDPLEKDAPSNHTMYPSMNNIPVSTKKYYDVRVLKINRAHVYQHHKSNHIVDGVWCVTTGTSTWVARRHGKVYLTGNSIIQGSAAEQTKMAMLLIDNDPEWNRIGGRILVPIHDEILAEVPIQYAEKGGEILSGLMCKAADFLPYKSKCDVETSYRWYGMEYPCPYDQPTSIDCSTWTESEIKWVQYHLVEAEYSLPVIKGPDGEKPRGDAAKGVNGVITDNMLHAMRSYMNRYNIREDMFIDHIKKTCEKGVYI